jgi:diguanylate cyclase (GGDEF)-like protein
MSRRRVPLVLGTIVLCCLTALVVGVGVYLSDVQTAARDKMHEDVAERSRLAADLAGRALTSSEANIRPLAEQAFAGPAAKLNGTLDEERAGLAAWAVVFRADGSLLAADPPAMTARASSLAATPSFALAVTSHRLALGDVTVDPTGASVYFFQPFQGSDGLRVLVMPAPVEQAAAPLSGALDVTASHAYVVDGQGNIIVSAGQETVGQPMPPSPLTSAVSHMPKGVVGGDFYVSNLVPGSGWRVIIAIPEAKLLAPLQATEQAAWQLFGAFAAAILFLIIIGVVAMISLFRLAHARAHDALTGLPSRVLFIDRTEASIVEQRRQSNGPMAALFIDLDGFKPINDTYGHAVGDALLKAVARRLQESMRPGDYVSRFGGDEFLILCKGLRAESDAHAVAERIRQYVAEPFDIAGQQVYVGTSIGIALLGEHAEDAEALIHNADLAMYHAKRGGKGRIEQFTLDMAGV